MEPIYRKEFTLEAIHADCFLRAKPSSLLYFVQEVAGAHCTQLDADWDTLHRRNLFWAVTRHKLEVERLPLQGETITVETWPMPTTRVAYPRATVAYDRQGNVLFRCVSLWVLMDTASRAMVLPDRSGVPVEGILRGTELAVPRSLVPGVTEQAAVRYVNYSLLDRNGHMNNTRYLDWVWDLLPAAFHRDHPVREFTVCYLSEATEGQAVTLDWVLTSEGVLAVDAHRERTDVASGKERVFAVRAGF